MHVEKLSISLPAGLAQFLDIYQSAHAYKSRSEVIQTALKLLQQKELENEYRLAAQELDSDFEITSFDGLDDETW